MSWDTEMADRCRLPEVIENICDGCRCFRYCHRQLKMELEIENTEYGRKKDGD